MLICVAGKNNIAVDVLEFLIANCTERYRLCVVCNQNETGRDSWQKSLRLCAEKNHIPEFILENLYQIEDLIFLSLEYDKIIKPQLFVTKKLYNIHFSLLPQYRGVYTSALPILNGETMSGVTFHRIDSGIDTGEIIAQEKFLIKRTDTCRDLYLRNIEYGTRLVISQLENVIADRCISVPQDEKNATYYSRKSIDYANLSIDMNQTAECIDRQLRAFTFREYQLPCIGGHPVIGSFIMNLKSPCEPGTVIFRNRHGMMLSTADNCLVVFFDRFTDLMKACKSGDFNTVKDICSVKMHIDERDDNGRTPLIVATCHNHIPIVMYLIMSGADIFVQDNRGRNILSYAKDIYDRTGDMRLFKLYLEMGISG